MIRHSLGRRFYFENIKSCRQMLAGPTKIRKDLIFMVPRAF